MSRISRVAALALLVSLAPQGAWAAETPTPTASFESLLQSLIAFVVDLTPGSTSAPVAIDDTAASTPVSAPSGPTSLADGGDEAESGPIYIPWG